MMKRFFSLSLAFSMIGGFSLAKAYNKEANQELDLNLVKAVRPDSPVLGDPNFPASCGDCCDDESAEDCRLVDIESLLEDLASDISVLSAFDQTCCAQTNSNISVLSAFDQTCCATTNSRISALSAFDQTCCATTNSNISVLSAFDQSALTATTSRISALSAFDQTCCATTNSNISVLSAFDQSALTATTSRISALSAFDQSCCAATGSSLSVLSTVVNPSSLQSSISALSAFDQSCCATTTALLQSLVLPSSVCTKVILQADINPVTGFTTTSSGLYCLGTDVTYPGAGSAITIANNNVTLELNGHSIALSNTAATGVTVNSVLSNIKVSDGIIAGNGGNGIVVGNTRNVVLSDLEISGTELSGLVTEATELLIQNVLVSESPTATAPAWNATGSNEVIAENCMFNGGTIGVFLTTATDTSLKLTNSIIQDATGDCFMVDSARYLYIDGVSFLNSAGNGLHMLAPPANTGQSYITNCFFGGNALNGFLAESAVPFQIFNLALYNCFSEGNNGDGYQFDGTGGINTFQGLIVEACKASKNGGFGFNIPNRGEDLVFKSCIASSNSSGGFTFTNSGAAGTTSCNIISCVATGGGAGFVNNGTDNFFANNTATGNATNYSGVPGVQNTAAPTTTTGFWANAFWP